MITGVHQTTLAIDMQMIQSMGGTPVGRLIALSNIAPGVGGGRHHHRQPQAE
ncbi:PTS system protein [Klebsiella pneumoniae subsp. ozaenae]|uniref:PTS system protein n=1 Tax=Klebsiella pneumoniae subsp. ozaenae TaxID=574 RepID=A0A378AYA6_KLEPO|nr:PTS system protein [Klebsiella pneumoniae subsp. ozaenae]